MVSVKILRFLFGTTIKPKADSQKSITTLSIELILVFGTLVGVAEM